MSQDVPSTYDDKLAVDQYAFRFRRRDCELTSPYESRLMHLYIVPGAGTKIQKGVSTRYMNLASFGAQD